MAPRTAWGIDLAGRKIAGTTSGLLDAHAYLYNSLQAVVIGWILDGTGGNWMLVFLLLFKSAQYRRTYRIDIDSVNGSMCAGLTT